MIIDTHAHLNDEYLVLDVEKIVKGFKENNIEFALIPGFDFSSSKLACELAEKYNQYAIIGTHPQDAENLTSKQLEVYKKLARKPYVVAVGEIGLDYYYDEPSKESQKEAFIKQILLADQLELPIVLHVRDAYKDTLDILKEYLPHLNNGILLHCYSGSAELIKEFNKFGCYYALGGAITFKNAKKDDVIKNIPLDKLVVETDCPYLTPVPFRGRRNEPKYINYVVEKIAEVLGKEKEEIIDITNKNARRLFFKIK